jgi:cytochrome P450
MQAAQNDLVRHSFRDDPLMWLMRAARSGPLAVIDPTSPVLTRDPAAAGCLVVFSAPLVRVVLQDLNAFRMPLSAAVRDGLPDALVNLNSGVFSMGGALHRERQQVMASLLGVRNAQAHVRAISTVVEPAAAALGDGGEVDVLDWARRVAGAAAERLVLGDAGVGAAWFVQRYFDLRRRHSAAPTPQLRAALLAAGADLDGVLRERIRAVSVSPESGGVLGQLLHSGRDWLQPPTEDEMVAHANILMASSSEPIATSMSWVLLALAQRPDVTTRLRHIVAGASGGDVAPAIEEVVSESLRLAPPNAVMVRVTTRAVRLAGRDVPAGTEVALSPFVEHRNPQVFPDPDRFRPARWQTAHPTPFQFLPFGAGARACLGRWIARQTVGRTVTAVLKSSVPVLPRDTFVDWRMDVTLAPFGDPAIRFTTEAPDHPSGQLLGPGRLLIGF